MLVGRKILIEGERAIERKNGYQVGRLHLVFDVIARGLLRPGEIVRLHRREIEEQDNQTVVVELLLSSDALLRTEDLVRSFSADRGLVESGGLIDIFKVEARNLLRLVVFKDGKVSLCEAMYNFASLLVANDYVGEDEIAVDLKDK